VEDSPDTILLEPPAAPPPGANRPRSQLGRLASGLPSLLVFSTLGGLLAWGHLTGWNLPRFSWFTAASVSQDDWCSQHSVPDSQCVECNPALMPRPKAFGWCQTHGVHECPLCHPEVAQTATRSQVTEADLLRAQRALDFCDRPENNPGCKSHQRRIQFVSQEAVAKAGIDPDHPVSRGPVVEAVTGNGEITYDPTLTARLSARVPGTVFRASKKVGDTVEAGEVVALVDAAEVGKAKAEFVQALVQVRWRTRTYRRLRDTAAAVPERTILESENLLNEAKIRLTAAQQALANLGLPVNPAAYDKVEDTELSDRLRFLGLPAELSSQLGPATVTANLLPVTAPFQGVVVSRDAVAGQVIDTWKVLFLVVDVRQMWLTLNLRIEDARSVALGQKVRFRSAGARDDSVGTIHWISTEIDSRTRTLQVRVLLPNPEGRLRSNTYATGQVILREEPQAVVVPNEALHWEGDCHVVFVRDKNYLQKGAPKVFHTRTVRPGARDDKKTEIIAGLLPGEVIAVKGSAALRAELLRGNLGEG
jgi:cobalt-zinc-cadmium efflux system membrane fusion protein